MEQPRVREDTAELGTCKGVGLEAEIMMNITCLSVVLFVTLHVHIVLIWGAKSRCT